MAIPKFLLDPRQEREVDWARRGNGKSRPKRGVTQRDVRTNQRTTSDRPAHRPSTKIHEQCDCGLSTHASRTMHREWCRWRWAF